MVNAEEVLEESQRGSDAWMSVTVGLEGEVNWGYPIAAPSVPDLQVETKSAYLIGEDGRRAGKVEGLFTSLGNGVGGIFSFPPVADAGVKGIEFEKTMLNFEDAPQAAFVE